MHMMQADQTAASWQHLLDENNLLRKEVRVARRASDITARLVVEQFARTEEALRRLEKKAQ
ncbi:MAG: hypothetical protein JRI36_11860, partial [Deltaproteobacteria bacterium]|nr:hypothetical protein [Deltaproteobacteria bacterium]